MKKIITSVGMIVFVGALVVGGTGAFFSDTETSTANVFTAGAIDLKIDSEQHYNGNECVDVDTSTGVDYEWVGQSAYPVPGSACDGTWTLTDLGITHQFFDFDDVKPGDEGENTISLHIDSNPAWVCADVKVTSNDDVSTVDPETDAGDTPNASSTFDGELAQNIEFTAWLDNASTSGAVPGDNIHQAGEVLYFSPGPASAVLASTTLTLADGGTGTPLPGGSTSYVGLAWCAGNMTASTGVGPIACDGAAMGNIAQTDSMTADITFRVEQSRNNEAFRCAPRVVVPETATVNVDKAISFTDLEIVGVDVSDFALTIDGPGAPIGVVDNVPTAGLPVGVYSISEVYSGVPANVTFNASFSGGCTEVGDTGVGTMTVVAGVNPTCVITNSVSLSQIPT